MGRASQKSIATSFQTLEPEGTKWHWYSYFGMAGNYLLMMFYTTVAGWMISYFFKMLKGDFVGKNPKQVEAMFGELLSKPEVLILDAGRYCCRIFDLFAGASKRGGKDYYGHDVLPF